MQDRVACACAGRTAEGEQGREGVSVGVEQGGSVGGREQPPSERREAAERSRRKGPERGRKTRRGVVFEVPWESFERWKGEIGRDLEENAARTVGRAREKQESNTLDPTLHARAASDDARWFDPPSLTELYYVYFF